MLAALYLQWRMILDTRKAWLFILFLIMPLVLTMLINVAGGFIGELPEEAMGIYLFVMYPYLLSMLMTLLYGTSALNAELEGKTITYLFGRRTPRWRILLGKYLALTTLLGAGLMMSLLLSWYFLGLPGGVRMVVALGSAAAGSVVAYTGIFLLLGVLVPKRPMIVGLLYTIFFEGMFSFIPAVVNQFTVTYYLRSLAVRVMGTEFDLPPDVARMVGDASIFETFMGLFCITGVSLLAAGVAGTLKEYVVTEQA